MIAALLLMLAPAGGIDWEKPSDRALMAQGFTKMAAHCGELGFTPLPAPVAIDDKMKAYLLLESSPEYTVHRWTEIFIRARTLSEAIDDEAFINRLGDAIEAAAKDPSSYDRALKLYTDTFMAPFEEVVSACRQATRDPFLGKNFVAGDGNADEFRSRMAGRFQESVAELRNSK